MINVVCVKILISLEFVTPEEMRRAEQRASEEGLSVATMMENAGLAVARTVGARYGPGDGRTLLVVCGSGNNGGDGLVAARYLCDDWDVRVVLLVDDPSRIRTEEARTNFRLLKGRRVTVALVGGMRGLSELAAWFREASVVLDAILGTGVRGQVREPFATAIQLVNGSGAVKVAVDIPSGLDPETGQPSAGGTVRADLTVALHRAKVGMVAGRDWVGELAVVQIGIPDDVT